MKRREPYSERGRRQHINDVLAGGVVEVRVFGDSTGDKGRRLRERANVDGAKRAIGAQLPFT